MLVKICGVCRPEDAAVAAGENADYLGVILARKGPRQQSLESAARIYQAAGDLQRVGVFSDQPVLEVAASAQQLQLDVIQLHGAETTQQINELECEIDCAIWKSVTLKDAQTLQRAIDEFADHIDGLLLDAEVGGSGKRFDWSFAQHARELLPANVKLIVAGGLTPDNVAAAIAAMNPDVVDVASGVEMTVCQKSEEKVRAFVRNAHT